MKKFIFLIILILALPATAKTEDPQLLWSTYYGNNDMTVAEAVAVGPDGSSVIVGFTLDFATFSIDAIVAQFSADGTTLMNETLLSGSGIDGAFGVSVNKDGIITIVGQTDSEDFPVTADALQDTIGGSADGFLVKLNPDFDIIYATYLGGSGEESIVDMAVDKKGAVIVCGYTASDDFPATEGAFQETPGGAFDAFVARIVPGADNQLTYATYLGGSGDDCDGKVQDERLLRQAVAVMPNGDIVVAGHTWSEDFPTTRGAIQCEHSEFGDDYAENADIYVTVLNPNTSGRSVGKRMGKRPAPAEGQLVYSTLLGGTGRDVAEDLIAHDSAKITLLGLSRSADFPVTPNALQGELMISPDPDAVNQDAIVVQLKTRTRIPKEAQLTYSTYFGGTGRDAGNGLYMIRSGDIVISGVAGSADFPTTDGSVLQGSNDIFITRMDTSRRPGEQLIYSTLFGGTGGEMLSVGPVNDGFTTVYIAGDTGSADLPGVEGSYDDSFYGVYLDAFVAKYYLGKMGYPEKSH